MNKEFLLYQTSKEKSKEVINAYAQTDHLSHRYLAYRDLPTLIKNFANGNRALDLGSGTGISSSFLDGLGFNVTGVDINDAMITKAQLCFPHIEFHNLQSINPKGDFDLVFSSFVLFDMKSKEDIISYLNTGASFLKTNGIIVAVTGSEQLYSPSKKWTAYECNFKENHNLNSGDKTKLILKTQKLEFNDYYWKELDYIECLNKTNFTILQIHRPLGSSNDPYTWEDERNSHPFTIYFAKKKK